MARHRHRIRPHRGRCRVSALYTAMWVADGPWKVFDAYVSLDGVSDLLLDALPLGEHTGALRLVDGQEPDFTAKVIEVGELIDIEIWVADVNEAKLAAAEAEVTRLRAVLESIAALQTEEPDDEDVDLFGTSGDEGYAYGVHHGKRCGKNEAAEMARAGLVKP